MTHDLKYIVVEYLPHMMDALQMRPARIDGHYSSLADAEEVARLWAEGPKHAETRIVVCEVVSESKAPAHWKARAK